MSINVVKLSNVRPKRPLAVESALVVAVFLALYLWERTLVEFRSQLLGVAPSDDLLVVGLVSGGFVVAGVALFAAAYVRLRDVRVGGVLPERAALRSTVLAVFAPAALVGVTKLVGLLTGVTYSSLTTSNYGQDATVTMFLTLAGLSLVVSVPVLLLICQVLVQGSFRRVAGGDGAVVLTTLFAGFVLMSTHGGLTAFPDRGKLAGAVLGLVALGVAVSATERVDHRALRYLGYLPATLFVALVVLAGVAAIGSVAGALFATTQVGVLAIAAYTYERTDSVLPPALAYLSLLLTTEVVLFTLEAGVRGW